MEGFLPYIEKNESFSCYQEFLQGPCSEGQQYIKVRKSQKVFSFLAQLIKSEQNYCALTFSKGQLISKADWRAIDSPKKRTDEFVLFKSSNFCPS